MRTIKELLILLDKEIDGEHFTGGLCVLMATLHENNIISTKEWRMLFDYINNNNPDVINMENKDNRSVDESAYWWIFGKKEPRHRYLQYLISRC